LPRGQLLDFSGEGGGGNLLMTEVVRYFSAGNPLRDSGNCVELSLGVGAEQRGSQIKWRQPYWIALAILEKTVLECEPII